MNFFFLVPVQEALAKKTANPVIREYCTCPKCQMKLRGIFNLKRHLNDIHEIELMATKTRRRIVNAQSTPRKFLLEETGTSALKLVEIIQIKTENTELVPVTSSVAEEKQTESCSSNVVSTASSTDAQIEKKSTEKDSVFETPTNIGMVAKSSIEERSDSAAIRSPEHEQSDNVPKNILDCVAKIKELTLLSTQMNAVESISNEYMRKLDQEMFKEELKKQRKLLDDLDSHRVVNSDENGAAKTFEQEKTVTSTESVSIFIDKSDEAEVNNSKEQPVEASAKVNVTPKKLKTLIDHHVVAREASTPHSLEQSESHIKAVENSEHPYISVYTLRAFRKGNLSYFF